MISKIVKIALLSTLALVVLGKGTLMYLHTQEQVPNNWAGTDTEKKLISEMVDAVIAKQQKEHQPGAVAKRDVHTKSHGTFNATFRIRQDIPESLKVGIFAKKGEYRAQVRFSNGAMSADSYDALPNVRGVAIKLHGVDGKKVLPGDENSSEHDFLLANDVVFFAPGVEDMHKLVHGEMGALIKQNPRVAALLADAVLKLVKNPLTTDYFSQVPYALGAEGNERLAVKYSLTGAASSFFSMPNLFDRHYLRHAAVASLNKGPVTMTFSVQVKQAGESIEDSSKPWTGAHIPVAELIFDKVEGMVAESAGEKLSFNPVRALPEHEPLGWPGRVRKEVYPADFKWRTEKNLKN